MKENSEELKKQQHKIAREVKIKTGSLIMTKLHVPIANSNKLSPKFGGQCKVIGIAIVNKYTIQLSETGEVLIRHVDDLKRTNRTSKSIDETETDPSITNEDLLDDTDDTHEHRRRLKSFHVH